MQETTWGGKRGDRVKADRGWERQPCLPERRLRELHCGFTPIKKGSGGVESRPSHRRIVKR